ncbi:hypothetical protein AGOR_G00146860 [Albula goreensis]|uniref:Rho GTPase-activating protein 45 n=1 Tax=Albula goreensis TaxID=1534307 RepID=A0A8T3DA71_9TELE|nr:hypothetical protein AGOR_G00146860 [Albula goreensis]
MLKRGAGGKCSYSPYSTGHREKKAKGKLDLLPNKPNIWLKQLSILQEQPRQDVIDTTSCSTSPPPFSLLDPSSTSFSSPGALSAQQGRLAGCPSPVGTLKRPTTLSRHASAAGFPLQSWVYNKGLGKGAATPSPTTEPQSVEPAAIEVEDIPALLLDVARFAEAVEKLKDVVLREEKLENRRPLAHECLGEVLRILRQVISTYPLLNTMETLTAAGKLISNVKGFHYEATNEADKKAFEKAIETIAVAFSSNVSELLMGEVDSSTLLSLMPSERSRSMDNLYAGMVGQGADSALLKADLQGFVLSAEEVDVILQRSEGGVDSALNYAKSIAKYMKDVISYVEKRIALELEFAKGLQRLYHTCKQSIAQPHMPFFSIYSLALEQDREQSVGVQQAAGTLHSQTFLQPLMYRKQEHEKRRKEIKEQWQRAKRKLLEAETNLRKAKQAYMARCEEHDKAKTVTSRAEEDGGSSITKSLDKKRRLEEEARSKAEEAEATYRTCIADAITQQQEQEHVKVSVLRQIQEVIRQSDQTLRSATISYNQIMHMQTVALPVHYQTLCESSKLYDPGQQYAAHVKDLQMTEEPKTQYEFEPYTTSSNQQAPRVRNDSLNTDQPYNTEGPASTVEPVTADGVSSRKQKKVRGHQSHKSWPTTLSDTESVGGGSGLESPSVSTGDVRKIHRTNSTGTMSSNEDLEEKDGNVASFEQSMNGIEPEIVVPSGPFRNVGLSKAAQTHRLRKLRTPSKCRECDSYVYFQGAECEECFLACHKKCLETLAIQCGHKKLQGRLQLFGRDFSQTVDSEGIPFIIKKCTQEIERRALKMKGIYRVNGVKTRVEKLCQAFENGKELVELSQASPHDISNVLKLYLRQLPEPIMPFRLYHSLMGLAKDSLQAKGPEGGAMEKGPELEDLGPETHPEILVLVDRLRELLKELPRASVATLHYIICHLRRIAEVEEDNKMNPSNLGIVFGPTLMRPRPTGATVSLSSLVDYPHQARIIEALIVFYRDIFQPSQDCSMAGGKEDRGEGDGQEASGEHRRTHSDDKLEELCGTSVGSSGSREPHMDSDSELEEAVIQSQEMPFPVAKLESETSTEDELLSPRGSVDLLPTTPDGAPPALPDSEPPDMDDTEQELASSLAELNTNQSNNTATGSAGLPLVRFCRGKLTVSRDKSREPEFV